MKIYKEAARKGGRTEVKYEVCVCETKVALVEIPNDPEDGYWLMFVEEEGKKETLLNLHINIPLLKAIQHLIEEAATKAIAELDKTTSIETEDGDMRLEI